MIQSFHDTFTIEGCTLSLMKQTQYKHKKYSGKLQNHSPAANKRIVTFQAFRSDSRRRIPVGLLQIFFWHLLQLAASQPSGWSMVGVRIYQKYYILQQLRCTAYETVLIVSPQVFQISPKPSGFSMTVENT